ncbi:MAG: response regulator [Proteobacteria bacterium]|nr:response regulator [Pseudomonadota bacterium]
MSAKRCLIVDDSRSARIFLTRILQRYDLQVDGAASAEEALQYLRAEHPDVIFMDHLMPGMDGFQALSAIKSDPRTAAIPVMMYTSQEGELYVDQARALGAVGVLPKQTLPDDVNRALQQLRLLGEVQPPQLVRAALTPAAGAGAPPTPAGVTATPTSVAPAGAAPSGATPAADAPPNLLSPELRAQLDALLRDHGVELRRFVAASLAQHTVQIISEVRALIDGTAPDAVAAPAAAPATEASPTAAPATAMPVAPEVAQPVAPRGRPRGGAAALWLGAVAALVAMAAGLFWFQAERQRAQAAARPPTTRAPVPVAPAAAVAAAPAVPAASTSADAATPSVTAPAPIELVESVPFGEPPLAGARIASLRKLFEQLAAAGFHGAVEISSYPGRFCMQQSGAAPQLPAADVAYSKCATVGNPVNYADAHTLQSAEFATLLAAQAGRGRGTLDVQLVVGSAADVATPYPAITAPLTAGEWNRAAAANNRIEVHTRPLP